MVPRRTPRVFEDTKFEIWTQKEQSERLFKICLTTKKIYKIKLGAVLAGMITSSALLILKVALCIKCVKGHFCTFAQSIFLL